MSLISSPTDSSMMIGDRCTIYDTDGSVLADIVPTVEFMQLSPDDPLKCIEFSSTVCRSGITENASETDLGFLTEVLFSLGLAVPRDMAKGKYERMGNVLKACCRDRLLDATSATYQNTQRILRLYRTALEEKLDLQKLYYDQEDLQNVDKEMNAQFYESLHEEWTDTLTAAIRIRDEPEEQLEGLREKSTSHSDAATLAT